MVTTNLRILCYSHFMAKLLKKTKRLILRPLETKDFEVWRTANSKKLPSQNKWDDGRLPEKDFTKAKFKALLKEQSDHRKADQYYRLGVFNKKTGALMGTVSAMNVVRGVTHSCYLGYFINNNYWGQGYGKEAALGMIHFCFKEMKLHRVEAGVEPTNRRSIMLAKSLGLRKEGLKKRMIFLRGAWLDCTMYSATCEEFGYKWKT